MGKARFCLIGSGWRAEYFLRVAKTHSDEFEVACVLCRSQEKAEIIAERFDVNTTTKEEDVVNSNPDFIVVSVSRNAAWPIAAKWKKSGYCVIMETPMGDTLDEIEEIRNSKNDNGLLLVAEQYRYYPTYKKIIDAVKSGMIGEPVCVNASIAHDYHGFNVIRELLQEPVNAPFKMRTEKYDLPVTKTGDRFNIYTDGEIVTKNRAKVDIVYQNGRIGFYDFDSDQYHSTIRHNTLKVTGTRGEIIDGVCYYLDDKNEMTKAVLIEDFQFAREEKTDDENAVYELMSLAYKVGKMDDISDVDERNVVASRWEDNFDSGLLDAYMTVMMSRQGQWIEVNA